MCLSHFMAEPDFEKIASRALNSRQWSKMRDAVDMIRAKVYTAEHVNFQIFLGGRLLKSED